MALVVVVPWFCGCSPQRATRTVEDSVTSGRITVACATEAFDLIARERSAFQGLYPQAAIEVRPCTSREAVTALFSGTAALAAISRELGPEERSAAVRGGLELEGYRFARDALVAVVNPENPVENLAVEDLRRIYDGRLASWAQVGGRNQEVVPVIQPVKSDVTDFFVQEVMDGEPMRARAVYEASDSGVVGRVAREAGAVGYVTLAWADRGARSLRLGALTGLPYWKPDPEAVYRGQYPLVRFYNLYVRATGPRLANGFITFVTSHEGQKIVHEAGLVPTTVPVRFVRRSRMLGTH
jgi:phosphate transport system substrate-binding protein